MRELIANRVLLQEILKSPYCKRQMIPQGSVDLQRVESGNCLLKYVTYFSYLNIFQRYLTD